MAEYEVVLCIVNAGYSDIVMDAAREVGARGGTVIHARGTANKEAEQFFHITIQPDKEIVMILVTTDIKDAVLHAVYQNAGLKSAGQGIAFALPVDDVVGISAPSAQPVQSNEPKADEQAEKTADEKEEQPAEEPADENK
ncbi:MAG: P-II family nitrogen regulator [Clostridia bacterium]|nr:P-II family nitrogen regulator [Clostridia bacterium]